MFILVLNEDNLTESFYPLTLTRRLIDLKVGIFSIKEKWETIALNQDIELVITSKIDDPQVVTKSIPANPVTEREGVTLYVAEKLLTVCKALPVLTSSYAP